MTVADMESAIIEKLKRDLPDMAVEPFPDDVRDYKLQHPNGAVLVAFEGTRYSQPQIEQSARMIEFSIIVVVRNLRSHTGAYATLDRTRQSVTGDLYLENMKLYPLSERFLFVEDGFWFYEMRFMLPTIYFLGE